MRVLFLTHRVPFPPNKGDKIRSFNILNHLLKHHEVFVACLVDDEADLRHVPELQRRVQRLMFARIYPQTKKLLALRSLFRRASISVNYFYTPDLQEQVDALLDAVDVDAIVCFSSPMAEYLYRSRHAGGKVHRTLRVMDLIDVDSHKWSQYAAQHGPCIAWVYRHEAEYLAQYERRIASSFDHVLVVSEQEKRLFPGEKEARNVEAMSNGVDLDYFKPMSSVGPSDRPTLVFTGVMDYWPNVEGVKWFVSAVLPRIREAVPDVALLIVGSRPTSEIERLGKVDGIVVTGFVDDVRTYVGRATVVVVPLRIARGIQNKVLEAMAMGKAVVCTSQSQEGIRAQPGEDLVVADDAEGFAQATIELLCDPLRAAQIGTSARQCVERSYTWHENLRVLDRLLSVSGRSTGSAEPRLSGASNPTVSG